MPDPGERLILALTGATAVGKTDAALAFADLVPTAIISLDSAMVYRGMDIGTAKPAPEILAAYPHALVDIRDPTDAYSAADFLHDADAAVAAALAAGKVPLLVGGTMLYLKVFREGLAAMPGADPKFRAELRVQAQGVGWPAIHARLAAIDPLAAGKIHPHNIPRIERALEVHALTGQPISSFWQRSTEQGPRARLGARLVEFALQPDTRAALHQRIAQRLEQMFAAGFVDEVETLRRRADLALDLPALRAVGYRQVWTGLDEGLSESLIREHVLVATRQLAKRQLTWLRGWRLEALPWGDPGAAAAQILALTRLAISPT